MDPDKKYSGILLAGGKSSRMKQDKAFLKFKERFLYEFSSDILKTFCSEIFISSSDLRFNNENLIKVEDEIPGIGPIGGIFSCLKRVSNQKAIILPCDLPLISTPIIEKLLENSNDSDITVALNQHTKIEPLIGIYSVSILPLMIKMIDSQNYKLTDLLKHSRTNFVDFPNESPEIFSNINYPDDYNKLLI